MKKISSSPKYYPLFLDIRSKKCLVVGGGEVAFRKIEALLEHGANVEVVSPAFCPKLGELARDGSIKTLERDYLKQDLDNAVVVIAATNDAKINEKVASDANAQRVLVNVVDAPELSNFIVPSYLKRGDVTISISTSGRSPALARKIKSRIERDFAAEYAELAILISEVRAKLKQQNTIINGETWQEALDLDPLLNLLKDGKRGDAKKMIIEGLGLAEKKRAV